MHAARVLSEKQRFFGLKADGRNAGDAGEEGRGWGDGGWGVGEERCEETSSWGNEGLVLPTEREREGPGRGDRLMIVPRPSQLSPASTPLCPIFFLFFVSLAYFLLVPSLIFLFLGLSALHGLLLCALYGPGVLLAPDVWIRFWSYRCGEPLLDSLVDFDCLDLFSDCF